ncbi:hypothetical protein NXX23_12335 [Bacteroides ovatus]|nr:hypothetical protein [Bacteroides ovatus]
MIGDTLSSQNTDTLSLLQQEQISPAKADGGSLQLVLIFMLYKRLIPALKEPLSPTLPVRTMLSH